MNNYKGKAINQKSAIGQILFLGESPSDIVKSEGCDTKEQIKRLKDAFLNVVEKIKNTAIQTNENKDTVEGITSAYIMLLSESEEESLFERTQKYIEDNEVNAEYALEVIGNSVCAEFEKSESEYFRARSEDIFNIKKMLLSELVDKKTKLNVECPTIIVADEISPQILLSEDMRMIQGIVTKNTSPLSHAAILAINMDIPLLTGIDTDAICLKEKTTGAIDGKNAMFITEPDDDMIKEIEKQIVNEGKETAIASQNLNEGEEESPILFLANIGKPEEALKAKEYGAAGIGLMRSEFLFMDRDDLPDEEEQYVAYSKVLDIMAGEKVIVRTIDIGDDKEARCISISKNDNHPLGLRGIRFCLANEEIFVTQIRALLRAAYKGNLEIMFPMITAEWEVKKAKEIIKETADKLSEEGINYAIPPIGIMIETPAAALCMESLAQTVDFVSIGTNDLTQYTLALSRSSEQLSRYAETQQKAVMKLIKMTVEEAKKAGIRAGICGELAADTNLTESFIQMGVDELSMAPTKIPYFKETIKIIY